jgi:hypothetical protein
VETMKRELANPSRGPGPGAHTIGGAGGTSVDIAKATV